MTTSFDGNWVYQLNTEFGAMDGSIELRQTDAKLTGTFLNMGNRSAIYDGLVDGDDLAFNTTLRTRSAVMMLRVEATIDGDIMDGMLLTPLGDSPFTAKRL